MKKSELIEKSNEIYNKIETAIAHLENAMDEVKSAFSLAGEIPEEASEVEDDSDGEDVAEPEKKK